MGNKVWNFGAGLAAEVSLKDFRKDIILRPSRRLARERPAERIEQHFYRVVAAA